MKRAVVLAYAVVAMNHSAANAAPSAAPWAITLGAGGGAHQAGMLYAILAELRSAQATDPPTMPLDTVAAFAGVSSGGINAVLGALTYCQDGRAPLDPERNPLWNLWKNVSWDALFPGDLSCDEYRARHPELIVRCTADRPYSATDGALTLNGFSGVRRDVLNLFTAAEAFLPSCGPFPVAIPLVAEDPATVRVGEFQVATGRRVVVASVGTDERGRLRVCDVDDAAPTASAAADPFAAAHRIHLPTRVDPSTLPPGACRPIAPDLLFEAFEATTAIPPFLVPHPLPVCGTDCEAALEPGLYCAAGTHLCRARFVDGALFDRLPLAAARDVAPEGSVFLSLEPRPANQSRAKAPSPDPLPDGVRGAAFYLDAASKFLEVASDYELQTLHRYEPELDVKRFFRRAPIFGEYLYGYAEFLDPLFSQYDYYTGIYEGLRVWAASVAQVPPSSPRALQLLAARYGGELGLSGDATALLAPAAPTVEATQGLLPVQQSMARAAPARPRDSAAERLPPGVPLRRSPGLAAVVASHLVEDLCTDGGDPSGTTLCPALRGLVECARQQPDLAPLLGLATVMARRPAAASGVHWSQSDLAPVLVSLRAAHVFPDDAQRPWLRNHDRWHAETLRQLAHRLEEIERVENEDTNAFALGLAQYALAIESSRSATGWRLGPATIPPRLAGSSLYSYAERTILPHTFATEFVHGGLRIGWELGGYRPEARWLPAWMSGATVNWFRHGSDGSQWRVGGVTGLHWTGSSLWASEFGVRGIVFPGQEDKRANWFGAELFARPLLGRVEISAGLRGLDLRDGFVHQLFINLGLADINGAVYWLLRSATGDDAEYHRVVRAATAAVAP